MKEPEIVVLSGENRLDQYGNFFFKDKAGVEHKIGEKRKDKDQIASLIAANPSKGVKLTYGEYKGFAFIEHIELVEDGLPEPVAVSSEHHMDVPRIDTPPKTDPRGEAIREGMWWKELGECLRSGLIDRETPAGKLLERFYKAEMQSVLGFKIEKNKEE